MKLVSHRYGHIRSCSTHYGITAHHSQPDKAKTSSAQMTEDIFHVGSTCSSNTSHFCEWQRQSTCALAGCDLRLPALLGLLALLPRHIKPIQLLLGAAFPGPCMSLHESPFLCPACMLRRAVSACDYCLSIDSRYEACMISCLPDAILELERGLL